MISRKKGQFRKPEKNIESFPSISVIVPLEENQNGLKEFLESLKKIKKPFEKDYEVIIPTIIPDQARKITEEDAGLGDLINRGIIKILPFKKGSGSYELVREGYLTSEKENILVFESDLLERNFNFEEFFSVNKEQLESSKILIPVFRNQMVKKGMHWPAVFYHRKVADYLFETEINTFPDYQQSFFVILNNLNIKETFFTISQVDPYGKIPLVKKGFFKNLLPRLSFFINWFFKVPVREIRTKPEKRFTFITIPSYFRLLFVALSFAIAIILPILSLDVGISGDEEKHYRHAEKVYNYFATRGEDQSALSDPSFKLNYYGQSFDLLTYIFNRIFEIDNVYETRHVFIALTGFLIILFTALLVSLLTGYRAGIITMVFMFFAPRFLGHSMNNPLDIPFALGYIFTIYQTFRFLKKLPVFSPVTALWITLGIAYTISIRIGGLMLIPYVLFFAGLYTLFSKWDFRLFSPEGWRFIRKGIIYLVIISISGYLLSLLLWPFGLQAPFKNPFEALRMMANINVAIRVLFNGMIFWSNKLPWYYISMNILFTVPVIILAGFILNVFIYRTYRQKIKPLFMLFLYFAVVFPVAYVVYKESNVYGGWRHLLFVFPPLAAISAITFESLIAHFRSKYVKYAISFLILLGLVHPVRHIIVNHPFEYIYFNELIGNVKNAYGRFENDYYLNSLRQGSEWLISNILPKAPGEEKDRLIVANNASVDYYFRHYKNEAGTIYTRYYDRGAADWDYAIFFCNYIDPYQLKNNIWPPFKTIHTIDVDDVPVCAIVKRESKDDYKAIKALDQKDFLTGITMLEKVIENEPYNEISMLRLAEAYIQTMQYSKAHDIIKKCLEIYPDYDKALNLKGIAYMQNEENDEAISTFIYITTKVNYRFVSAYHNLALIYVRRNDAETAKNYLKRAIEVNKSYKPAYLLMADILKAQGLTNDANRYLEAANSF